MRVGFVRNVGLAALSLAVAALAACNDDPLGFDTDQTTDIFVNPSVMVIPAGRTSKLESRALNQGLEPTFADVLVNDTRLGQQELLPVGCATVAIDPDAPADPDGNLVYVPPGLFVVTALNTLGSCTFTLSVGGVSKDVDVTVVADGIEFVNPPASILFEGTAQLEVRLISLDGATVTPFDPTDAVWSSDDTAVLTVDETGFITGVGPGTATVEVCWSGTDGTGTSGLGVERCAETAIEVVVGVPDLTSLSPASGAFQGEVTVNGTGFVSVHQLYIDGFDYSYLIESRSATALTFQWPNLGNGAHSVEVGIPGSVSNALTFTQTSDVEANEPENDDPATTTATMDAGGVYVGGFVDGGADEDDWIIVTVGADGDYAPVLHWNSGQDLDFYLYPDDGGAPGDEICHSWYSQPEDECGTVTLTAGTYWVLVQDFTAPGYSSYAVRFDPVE